MKKTKIICTIGPSCENEDILREMMQEGMNAARLNFSHGTHEEHIKKINLVKKLRAELSLHISLILDTKGPEIRTGRFSAPVELKEGQKFTITTEDIMGSEVASSVSYKGLPGDVKPGDQLLIDDGLIGLTIDHVQGGNLICTVNNGGTIKDYKSINVPGVEVKLPPVTDRDKEDILLGIAQGVDYIAASFVRKPSDVAEMRNFLQENGGEHIRIISKIENKEGVDNLDEIVALSDAIMVARGDLGVEIPAEQVPIIQKKIIKLCNLHGKPVITATQMLDSMIRNPRPTRAEVSDVSTAILDGTDAIMLSGETASGKYPVESVKQMFEIARVTEESLDYGSILQEKSKVKDTNITNAIGHATCTSAHGLKASAILTPTTSGHTAMVVSKFRPKAPIVAFTPSEQVARYLSLVWGVRPLVRVHVRSEEEVFREAIETSLKKGIVQEGDLVVLTAGAPMGVGGTTNMLRIHEIGNDI